MVRPLAVITAAIVLLGGSLLGGCASRKITVAQARDGYAAGDLAMAADVFDAKVTASAHDADAAELDLAMVELASGDAKSAEARLRKLRDRFEDLPTVTPVREAASMVTDDRTRMYRPAGYELVMIRAMLAVCSLATDAVDAEAYALQATMKQSELARAADEKGLLPTTDAYQPLALAPYLRGVLREATHHDYDDAESAYRLVSTVRPQFAPAADDIARATHGAHSQPGHGALYVIACVGRGPVLAETTAPTTSTALSIASSVLNAETNQGDDGRVDGVVLPNIAEVKIPAVVVPPSPIAAVGVRFGGAGGNVLLGATQTLTDVAELATKQNEAEMPATIARAVVRRVTKEAAVAKTRDSLGLSGQAGSLFHFAAASAWAGIEKADTRCWGLLPREIQVFRCELPAGSQTIALEPLGYNGAAVGPRIVDTVAIENGRNTYRVVIAPAETIHVVANGL
jgi:uncharacterized protein